MQVWAFAGICETPALNCSTVGDGGRVEPIERRPDGHLDNDPDPQYYILGATAHSKSLEQN